MGGGFKNETWVWSNETLVWTSCEQEQFWNSSFNSTYGLYGFDGRISDFVNEFVYTLHQKSLRSLS